MAFVKLADNYTDLIGKFAVALREEGLDRNPVTMGLSGSSVGRRPPRGGRG